MANAATLTSPDGLFTATVTIQNAEMVDGAYPIVLSSLTPAGQQFAVEYNGQRQYEDIAQTGSGTS